MLPPQNLSASQHRLLGVEGRVPDDALVHDNTHGPPVALLAIPPLHEHFRGDVIRGADGGESELSFSMRLSTSVGGRELILHRKALALLLLGFTHVIGDPLSFLTDIHLLAETQVRELQVSVPVEQDVVWLQISVNVTKVVNWGRE